MQRFISTCSTWVGSARTRERAGRENGFDFDIAADYFFEKVESFGDALVQVDIARLENLAASKSQELARECGGAFGLLMDFLEMAAEASAFLGLFHADIGPAHDGADHVVEVVRDSTGELADGFELLRLQELLFKGQAFRDILDDDFRALAVLFGVDDAAAAEPHGDDFGVFAFPFDRSVNLSACLVPFAEFSGIPRDRGKAPWCCRWPELLRRNRIPACGQRQDSRREDPLRR